MTKDEYKEWFANNNRIENANPLTAPIYTEDLFQAFKSRMLHEIKAQEDK